MKVKAAVYYRVSSEVQTIDCQKPEVEQLARARAYTISHVYEEQGSAAKHRPQHEQLLKDAKRGKFDVLIVWALDRFGRSMVNNVGDVLELDRIGVKVISVRESWLDTGGPVRSLLIAIFSWVAEQERVRLIERTKVGMAAARKRGSKIGRPRAKIDEEHLRELHSQGHTVREIATDLGVGTSTVQRRLGGLAQVREVA